MAAIGPFLQSQGQPGQDVQLGGDASLAFLVWREEAKKTAQVVVAGPDAKVRFRVDCKGPVMSPLPALEGMGVLLQAKSPPCRGNCVPNNRG